MLVYKSCSAVVLFDLNSLVRKYIKKIIILSKYSTVVKVIPLNPSFGIIPNCVMYGKPFGSKKVSTSKKFLFKYKRCIKLYFSNGKKCFSIEKGVQFFI